VSGGADRRAAVRFLTTRWKLSERSACGLAGISRSALTYRSRRKDEPKLVKDLKELARRHPRYGYRRLWAMLRRQGWTVNVKRVRRLCVLHGLKLRRRSKRKRRGQGGAVPCVAEHANHVWTCDFVHDACENGRKLKLLTVLDEFTRQCHRIEVATRLSSRSVIAVMAELFALHGVPRFLRSDNGPEFIAKALTLDLEQNGCGAKYIDPGSPWQNGHCESFNGKLRDECLNLEVFHHPDHARAVVELWRRHYNQDRPHSSLAHRTPSEFAAKCAKEKKTNAWTAAPAVVQLPSGRHRRITSVSSVPGADEKQSDRSARWSRRESRS
jgi:putative transposase